MSYKFNDRIRVIINGKKIILGNGNTGDWILTSKQAYDILNLGINNSLTRQELLDCLFDNEDRIYIEKIYKNLHYLGIIEDENNIEALENKIVSFEITHRCNLKCTHCCIDADEAISNTNDLTTDNIKEILKKIVEWNPKKILLSGGEPMIRPDFFEIITYLRNIYSGKIVISTNGTCINYKNIDDLVRCVDQIDLSLDGIDEETCSVIRGEGVFEKVIKSIKLLKNKKFEKITLSMVISDSNIHLKDKFISLCNEIGVKPITRGFQSIGRGEINKEKFLSQVQNKSFLSEDINKNLGVCNCSAMNRELFFSYDGSIYPCPALIKPEYLLGNILNIEKIVDLEVLNRGTKPDILIDILKSDNLKECIECKVNLFCLGCPGIIDSIKHNKSAIKNRCDKLKAILYKKVWGE